MSFPKRNDFSTQNHFLSVYFFRMSLLGVHWAVDLGDELGLPTATSKAKHAVHRRIRDSGGVVDWLVNRRTDYILVPSQPPRAISECTKVMSARKKGIPIITFPFFEACVAAGAVLSTDSYIADFGSEVSSEASPQSVMSSPRAPLLQPATQSVGGDVDTEYKFDLDAAEQDGHPPFPSPFIVAKVHLFTKPLDQGLQFRVIELHVAGPGTGSHQYRVVRHEGTRGRTGEAQPAVAEYPATLRTAEARYADWAAQSQGWDRPALAGLSVGSRAARALAIGPRVDRPAAPMDPELQSLIEELYAEAWGRLRRSTRREAVPEHAQNALGGLTLVEVAKAEAMLHQLRLVHSASVPTRPLLRQLWGILQPTAPLPEDPEHTPDQDLLGDLEDLCEALRDLLSVGEAACGNVYNAPVAVQYDALGCHLRPLSQDSVAHAAIAEAVARDPGPVKAVRGVYRVHKYSEHVRLRESLGNAQLLYHGSPAGNWVGILSRGLQVPKFDRRRRDFGMLGRGIYFASRPSTACRYTLPGRRGTCFLAVCRVLLGRCRDVHTMQPGWTVPPEAYDSVHGVPGADFEDDEYVVYDAAQQALVYLVEVEPANPDACLPLPSGPVPGQYVSQSLSAPITLGDIAMPPKLAALGRIGLVCDGAVCAPLQGVCVKVRLIDLIAEVVVFQQYKSPLAVPVEAKYVFPLHKGCVVCGFEAYIGAKHVVGVVREKEEARREYHKAVAQGHGAYLMEEGSETPETFTVAVGNLPSHAEVVVQIMYLLELHMEPETNQIVFTFPAAAIPRVEDAALQVATQTTTDSVAGRLADVAGFALEVGAVMPYDILGVWCSHAVAKKQTQTCLMLKLQDTQKPPDADIVVRLKMESPSAPRLWVETNNKGHKAAMLTVYPSTEDLQPFAPGDIEVLLVLDMSCSMAQGDAFTDLQRVTYQVLKLLPPQSRFQVISFGSVHQSLFATSQPRTELHVAEAVEYLCAAQPIWGGSCLSPVLQGVYSLADPTRPPRSIFLFSDGDLSDGAAALALVRANRVHTRLFTFGVGACNSHFLQLLAAEGGGKAAIMPHKQPSTWASLVEAQVRRAGQSSFVNMQVDWSGATNTFARQEFSAHIQPAPRYPPPVFAGEQAIAYAFAERHVRRAELTCMAVKRDGDVVQEVPVNTFVETRPSTETRGQIVHRLTAMKLIRDWQNGLFSLERSEDDCIRDQLKQRMIELGCEYGIVTPYTSMFAVEERDSALLEGTTKGQVNKFNSLVAAVVVDPIPELSFEAVQRGGVVDQHPGREPTFVPPAISIRNFTPQSLDKCVESDAAVDEEGHRKMQRKPTAFVRMRAAAAEEDEEVHGKHVKFGAAVEEERHGTIKRKPTAFVKMRVDEDDEEGEEGTSIQHPGWLPRPLPPLPERPQPLVTISSVFDAKYEKGFDSHCDTVLNDGTATSLTSPPKPASPRPAMPTYPSARRPSLLPELPYRRAGPMDVQPSADTQDEGLYQQQPHDAVSPNTPDTPPDLLETRARQSGRSESFAHKAPGPKGLEIQPEIPGPRGTEEAIAARARRHPSSGGAGSLLERRRKPALTIAPAGRSDKDDWATVAPVVHDTGTLRLELSDCRPVERRPQSLGSSPPPPRPGSAETPGGGLLGRIQWEDLKIGHVLGASDRAAVRKVKHRLTGQLYALKSVDLKSDEGIDKNAVQTTICRLAAAAHPNIVSVHEAFCVDGKLQVLMEYMNVGALSSVLQTTGPFPYYLLSGVVERILLGLGHLHASGIVHGNLKPSNVLLNAVGELKISDFGLGTTGARCAAYMSPEQIRSEEQGAGVEDAKSDIWSVGLTCAECALGLFPFCSEAADFPEDVAVSPVHQRPGMPELRAMIAEGRARVQFDLLVLCVPRRLPHGAVPELSDNLKDFCRQCMAQDVAQRPSCPELLGHPFLEEREVDFGRWLGNHGITKNMHSLAVRRPAVLTPVALMTPVLSNQ